jgi:hypothetical protein
MRRKISAHFAFRFASSIRGKVFFVDFAQTIIGSLMRLSDEIRRIDFFKPVVQLIELTVEINHKK